ncbi:putative archaeal kinase [Archaeoglobus sulfaticallidus PM70-1]|uniref:Isopentenyl phosphate kinase n=1 Tax=Archaeoglobus sulfaticallidus PM70-1 TaxID=387631 RepID=N0BEA5_9EURY|nr:isopentenyl phosphate kinase [Archaeoglobus sulfaticallidus]AGK60557.1 putative archaeal kinase [Archaeoglobus sulfaticallidus PM70-1]
MRDDEIIILKIGGSIITDKSKGSFEKAKFDVIERISREISQFLMENRKKIILVHGAGSFGHPHVEKYNLKEKKELRGVLTTHFACKRLNSIVCDKLLENGVHALGIHPLTSFFLDEKLNINIDLFLDMLTEDIIPVTHGDMIYNRKRKFFEVLSGDSIISALMGELSDRKLRVGLATDVDGVIYDGRVVKEINADNFEEVLSAIDKSAMDAERKSDVTGGMKGKIGALFRSIHGSEVRIFNGAIEGNIIKFLKGEALGTLIRGK